MPEREVNPDLCVSEVQPDQVQASPSRESVMAQQSGNQVVGNIGMCYAAYRLRGQRDSGQNGADEIQTSRDDVK
jgi:hypothetical protein